MTKALVIVFVKNITLGTVKTRLAKTIGDIGAFEVYSELVKVTEKATRNLNCDIKIYYSSSITESHWPNENKTVQQGEDLGEKMYNAFNDSFNAGYKKIVLIGSDLPTITSCHIKESINSLDDSVSVFGPAEDGGYYLIGLRSMVPEIFQNKPWSQNHLLKTTLQELQKLNVSVSTLETLNDIDTYEDLIASDFYKSNLELQEKIQQLND
ncbi:TIGR04282 family arsenosugar biosynthesis glycosyltransferase [Winogradskyella sp. KYW1333]|jgi:rSAM/selenodomain-associated transferase 1|uniref:TIGR04282 family arsenosugar biosynthesis glycosyltransferase n=2 Tax=unclassified Winogradskyella TaxID=2615021 RepID=UPI000DF484DE|nr:TIGR04282 family arsenosugar biosynthesis glycosyltransferase [Winogradskyella sp. KYW1333]RCT53944.1 glycosyltransferase [Winogradskyella sp. KYW1333]